MKYIKTYESFGDTELVNEEILGLGKFLGNLFKKAKERLNKTKGGKEVEVIYQKYLKMINDALAKQAKINITVMAEAPEAEAPNTPVNPEAAKLAVETLKKQKSLMDQIVKKTKETALKEMDAVLTKMGGSSKNPQLAMIVQSKKDQFDLDFMNAQINYLEQQGDKTYSAELAKSRDAIMKKVEDDFKDFDTAKPVEYKTGDSVKYKKQDGTENEAEIIEIKGEDVKLKTEKSPEGFEVKLNQLSGKVEGEKAEGQEELVKKLGELKTKKPEDIKKVGNFVDFIEDEKNKAKVAEIEKIMSEEGK